MLALDPENLGRIEVGLSQALLPRHTSLFNVQVKSAVCMHLSLLLLRLSRRVRQVQAGSALPHLPAWHHDHRFNKHASAETDRLMPYACRRRIPPPASALFQDGRCFSLPHAARLATAFASISLSSQGLSKAGGGSGHGSDGRASGSIGGGSGGQGKTGSAEPGFTENGAQPAAAEQSSAAEDLILLDVSGVPAKLASCRQHHRQRLCCWACSLTCIDGSCVPDSQDWSLGCPSAAIRVGSAAGQCTQATLVAAMPSCQGAGLGCCCRHEVRRLR